MKLERTREAEILADYEAALADAEERLADAQHDVDSLRSVVTSIRQRVAAEEGSPAVLFPITNDLPTYRGLPSLRAYLVRLMELQVRMTKNQLVTTVQAEPAYSASPPNRNTILSRASDLVRLGYLSKPTDDEYAFVAAPNGSGRAPGAKLDVGELFA